MLLVHFYINNILVLIMIYTKHCSIKKDYLGKVVLDNNMLNAVTYVSEENKIYYRRNRPIDYFDVFDYRIEYIENFDTCYIDTGIKGSGSQRVECEFMPIQKTDGYNCVYGARTTAGKKDDGIYIYSNNSKNNINRQYIAYNTAYAINITSTINLNTRYTIVQDKWTFILNGNVIKTHTDATFTCPTATIFIFDGNNNGTRGNYNGYFRLYSFKLWNDDVLVRDYIPVVKDNIAYLYDKVSGQLFGNASGSGNFYKGPILEEDKNRLVRIQYLESNGTQWIDTGVTTLNTFAGIDTYISFPTYTQNKWGVGYNNYSSGNRSGFQIGMYSNNIQMHVYNADKTVEYIKVIDYDSNTHHFIINCLDVGLELDEVTYQSNQITDLGSNGGNICLFTRGGNVNENYRPNCRIESAKIYLDNNRLVRDFIPVRLKNRGYMFDRITGVLYGGVGDFVLGPDI